MSRPKILLIDNDQPWINNVQFRLKKRYIVEVALDSETACELLQQYKYDLVVVSALQTDVIKTIYQKFPFTRLIVATNKPTPQEAITMYDYGALDYFAKEFDDDVKMRIKRAIRIPVLA